MRATQTIALSVIAFLVAFALLHAGLTSAAIFQYSTSDLTIFVMAALLLAKSCYDRRAPAGFVLAILVAFLYFLFLRSGRAQISGTQLVLFVCALGYGAYLGPVRRHLVFPLLCILILIGLLVGWLDKPQSHSPAMTGLLTALLAGLGIFGTWATRLVRSIHLPALHNARASVRPLMVFLALYAICIIAFALLYRAINNTYPNSFSVVNGDSSSSPQIADLLTYSMALMINSSYANYSNILPSNHLCRSLALFQSFLGIIFFAIYLQLLLSQANSQATSQPK